MITWTTILANLETFWIDEITRKKYMLQNASDFHYWLYVQLEILHKRGEFDPEVSINNIDNSIYYKI